MDHLALSLLEFPPPSGTYDDAIYHKAAKAHCQKVEKLMTSSSFKDFAPRLLDHVHPEYHSISYLSLLIAIKNAGNLPLGDLLAKITVFLNTFDSIQVRYAAKMFTTVLEWLSSGTLFPASVAAELLATALLKLDPWGSVLTSHHVAMVKLAYTTDDIQPILPVIEKDIVFYPGMKGSNETRPLCDENVPPPAYLTVESGLTRQLSSNDVLQYDFLRGLCFIQRQSWKQAFDALERVITYPTREHTACSKIMVEAHNKWILVGLLLNGKAPALPATTALGPQKAYSSLSKPYQSIARAFEENTATTLKGEFEALGAQFWAEENNLNLMRLVLQHYQRWQILRLRGVYTKISLEQIRQRTQNAETAAPLQSEAEIEEIVQSMIDNGMLTGVIERPENGDPRYLTFLDGAEEPSEAEFAMKMVRTAQRLEGLGHLIKTTNERLGTSRDYIRFLVNQQKKEKDAGARDYNLAFINQVEDEDLMTGVMAGY